MAGTAEWITCGGTTLAALALGLSIGGLFAPWWSSLGPAGGELPQSKAWTSLWLSVDRSWEVLDSQKHKGCSNECDQTRWAPARELVACETWGRICTSARARCNAPPSPPPSMPKPPAAPPPTPAPPPAPPPPPPVGATLQPALRPPMAPLPVNVGVPTTFASSSSTRQRVLPPTTTTLPTTTTWHLQTLPPAPPLQLGPTSCPELTAAEKLQAAYTPWELHWSLSHQVIVELDKQLNRVFSQIPPRFFAQRPTTLERVRLVWEALAARCSSPGQWLQEHSPCPSAPAKDLFFWLHRPEQESLKRLARQFLEPPHMVPPSFSDCGLKAAWDSWEYEMRVHGRIVSVRQQPTLPPLTLTPKPSPPTEAPQDAPAPSLVEGPVLSFLKCHQASLNRNGSVHGNLWQSDHDPCGLATACTKLWVARVGLFGSMALGLIYTIPSAISFMGSEQRFVMRFPPALGVYLSCGCLCLLTIGEVVALTISTPQDLSGAGFGCTTAAVVLSFLATGLSKVGSDMSAGAVVVEPEGKVSVSTAPPHRGPEPTARDLMLSRLPSSPTVAWQP